MQLTEHFVDTELGVAGCGVRLIASATILCKKLLEPLRAQFGPIEVDDGYRDPAHNARVGGALDSQHLYLGGNAAADVRPMATQGDALSGVFEWIRIASELPFDQVILETNAGVPACIHLSYNRALVAQRRMALTGETNGRSGYVPVAVS